MYFKLNHCRINRTNSILNYLLLPVTAPIVLAHFSIHSHNPTYQYDFHHFVARLYLDSCLRHYQALIFVHEVCTN